MKLVKKWRVAGIIFMILVQFLLLLTVMDLTGKAVSSIKEERIVSQTETAYKAFVLIRMSLIARYGYEYSDSLLVDLASNVISYRERVDHITIPYLINKISDNYYVLDGAFKQKFPIVFAGNPSNFKEILTNTRSFENDQIELLLEKISYKKNNSAVWSIVSVNNEPVYCVWLFIPAEGALSQHLLVAMLPESSITASTEIYHDGFSRLFIVAVVLSIILFLATPVLIKTIGGSVES